MSERVLDIPCVAWCFAGPVDFGYLFDLAVRDPNLPQDVADKLPAITGSCEDGELRDACQSLAQGLSGVVLCTERSALTRGSCCQA
jgi:hypothetical protein